ncbi:MAG: AI-2E family transporter [Bacteroidales bacterium]
MNTEINSGQASKQVRHAMDITIKVGVVLLLLAWCFWIISPFVSIMFWAIIIAVTLYPLYTRLAKKLKNRNKVAAAIVTMILLAILLVPGFIFTESMVAGVKKYSYQFNAENFTIPPPDEQIKNTPLVGDFIYDTWAGAYDDFEGSVKSYSSQLKSVGQWFLDALMGTGMGFLQFLISILISGVLLATSNSSSRFLKKLFIRLIGEKGEDFALTTENTIRNVSKGVIGVAFIQAFLAGLVFVLAGVPYAGLWAIICLILAIVQIGPGLVIIPVIIYLFSVSDTWVAILWTIALVMVMLSDNIIKPLLMGKGASVPTLVIFLGSIGGFITSGFMGLFLGAVILALGYKLILLWVGDNPTENLNAAG